MLRSVLDPLISIIYPQKCHVCGGDVESSYNGVACETCWKATRIFKLDDALCKRCGAVLAERSETCTNCVNAVFDAAIAIGVYERALAATIVQLKKVPHLPARMIEHVDERLADLDADDGTAIVPIPLSKRRLFERGFNQAEIIAQAVAGSTGMPCLSNCLDRADHTPMHRMAMDKKAREATVRNAFKVRAPKLIAGRKVILVDDVLTSGSTASACASELKKHGAAKVTIVTLSRAVMYK